MEKEIAKLARAGRKGIIIDTNLLVLYLVGLYRKECVGDFVTSKTQPEDFNIIKTLLQKYKFDKCIVTPHILAEVSNLTFDQFLNTGRGEYTVRAISFIKAAFEEHTRKDDLIDVAHLPKLGFTDSSIIEIAKKNEYLVLTEDFNLAQRLKKEGCLVVNINHIRQMSMGRIT